MVCYLKHFYFYPFRYFLAVFTLYIVTLPILLLMCMRDIIDTCITLKSSFLDLVALTVLCCIGKLFVASSVVVGWVQVGELFPTPLRGVSFGITETLKLLASLTLPSLMSLVSNVRNNYSNNIQIYSRYFILVKKIKLSQIAIYHKILPSIVTISIAQTIDNYYFYWDMKYILHLQYSIFSNVFNNKD